MALILWQSLGYRLAFGALLLPAIIAMALVVGVLRRYPNPRDLAPMRAPIAPRDFSRTSWIYCTAGALIGAGYADFALVACHFTRASIVAAP